MPCPAPLTLTQGIREERIRKGPERTKGTRDACPCQLPKGRRLLTVGTAAGSRADADKRKGSQRQGARFRHLVVAAYAVEVSV